MRSIIECSVYIIVMTVICFISLDFIIMNAQMTNSQETIDYIRDYVEIYGTSVTAGSSYGESTDYMLDSKVLDKVVEIAGSKNIAIDIGYEKSTEHYNYYRLHAEYNIKSALLGISKKQVSDSLIRTEMDNT